jgi:hypothetical protein
MPIENHTDFLNEKMYRRLIENIVLHLGGQAWDFMHDWTIRIRPLSQTREEFFLHTVSTSGTKINTGMPSGVTGQYVMDLFLHDSTNQYKFRENSDRIQHEVCHAMLIGTDKFVSGVHDKVSPAGTYLKSFKFGFWTNRWKFWNKIPITVIDIRDDIP